MRSKELQETLLAIGRCPDMFYRDTPLLLQTLDGLKGIDKMIITVTLKKGHKGERVFEHVTQESAERRVDALCELHTCEATKTEPFGNWIVDASGFYDGVALRGAK